MKRFKILTIMILAGLACLPACEEKPIDTLYTNPDAIVDRIRTDHAAREANDPDFIMTGEKFYFDAALAGTFGTTSYTLELDSTALTYDVVVGDTVEVDNLRAKEADVKIRNQIYYSLIFPGSRPAL